MTRHTSGCHKAQQGFPKCKPGFPGTKQAEFKGTWDPQTQDVIAAKNEWPQLEARSRPQGTALAPQSQITSGQGTAAARLADRWQGLPGQHLPKVWPAGSQGQVQGADTKAKHRLDSFRLHQGHWQHGPTLQGPSGWPGARAWLPGVASMACQKDFSPQVAASSCPPRPHPHKEGLPQGP